MRLGVDLTSCGTGEVYRNADDNRRSRLTHEKVQHIERALRYADSGDGHARLEGLDLYDPGAQLVAELIVENFHDLVELELDGTFCVSGTFTLARTLFSVSQVDLSCDCPTAVHR